MTSGIRDREIGIRSGIPFWKIDTRKGYVFEALVARPQPECGQVHIPGHEVVDFITI